MSQKKPVRRKEKPLGELREIARVLTKEALAEYEIPEEVRSDLVLGTYFEPEHRVFELYRPATKPEDAQVISRVTVHAVTGEASVEVFLKKKKVSLQIETSSTNSKSVREPAGEDPDRQG